MIVYDNEGIKNLLISEINDETFDKIEEILQDPRSVDQELLSVLNKLLVYRDIRIDSCPTFLHLLIKDKNWDLAKTLIKDYSADLKFRYPDGNTILDHTIKFRTYDLFKVDKGVENFAKFLIWSGAETEKDSTIRSIYNNFSIFEIIDPHNPNFHIIQSLVKYCISNIDNYKNQLTVLSSLRYDLNYSPEEIEDAEKFHKECETKDKEKLKILLSYNAVLQQNDAELIQTNFGVNFLTTTLEEINQITYAQIMSFFEEKNKPEILSFAKKLVNNFLGPEDTINYLEELLGNQNEAEEA